jgi:uncharacterized protein YkwD
VKHYLIFLFFFVSTISLAQGNILLEDQVFQLQHIEDQQLKNVLSSDSLYQTLPPYEKQFFYWTNLLRIDPLGFRNTILIPFLTQFPSANNKSASSLLQDLSRCGKLTVLLPNVHLFNLASTHSFDLAHHQNDLSHTSSNGKDFQVRMLDAGITTCAGENLLKGTRNPLISLIILLIDHNVPGYGHRKALLNPQYNIMGCSYTQVLNTTQFILVQLFSCK